MSRTRKCLETESRRGWSWAWVEANGEPLRRRRAYLRGGGGGENVLELGHGEGRPALCTKNTVDFK